MNPRYHDIICARPGAKTAVLLLHGILSAPQYFRFLLDDIPQNYAVSGILLEGHGGEPADLAGTDMQAWKRQVQAQYRRLSAKYPHIIIAAHSMGTLFALQLARRYPERISRMLLLGVPLKVHLKPFGAECSLLAACGMHLQNPKRSAMQHAYSILPDCNPLHYAGWIPRYKELFDEIEAVNAVRMENRVPCAVYQSAADELVSLDALPLLQQMPAVRLHVLRYSTHFYFPPQDQERILRCWRHMLLQTKSARDGIPPCK